MMESTKSKICIHNAARNECAICLEVQRVEEIEEKERRITRRHWKVCERKTRELCGNFSDLPCSNM